MTSRPVPDPSVELVETTRQTEALIRIDDREKPYNHPVFLMTVYEAEDFAQTLLDLCAFLRAEHAEEIDGKVFKY